VSPSPAETAEDLVAELSQWTGFTAQETADFLSADRDAQDLILEGYRGQEWTRPGTSTFARVMVVLGLLATLAGIVSGLAGAASAVNALKAL
jgi:hypothetical protein